LHVTTRVLTTRLTAAAVVASMLITTSSVSAQSGGDARSRRQQVREQQASTAADLDALQATDEQLQVALAALRRDVAAQQGALEDARRGVARAERDIAEAVAAQRVAQAQIDALEVRQQILAVDSYVRAGSSGGDIEVLNERDPLEAAERQALLDLTTGRNADLGDQLVGARQDLRDEQARAEEAEDRAAEHRDRVADRLADVQAAQARQGAFAADVDRRIESRLAEAANLEALDADLSAQLAAQQAALARQVPTGSTNPVPVPGGPVSLATVGGITVAASLAGQLQGLLNASRVAGLSLGGGGYRDPAAQMAVRRANCPDPINSPPSACSPPTARVGTSMHEQGLAIDFTNNGRLISSRSDPAFVWLSANAGSFGLRNLPSEPWHWSTTGG